MASPFTPIREFVDPDPYGFGRVTVINARKRALMRRWLVKRGFPSRAVSNLTVSDLQHMVRAIRRLQRVAVLKDRGTGNILNITDRGPVERELCCALRCAIAAHGPITWANSPSAAKRMYSSLKIISRQQRSAQESSDGICRTTVEAGHVGADHPEAGQTERDRDGGNASRPAADHADG